MKNLTKIGLLTTLAAITFSVSSCKKNSNAIPGDAVINPDGSAVKLKTQSYDNHLVGYWPLDGNTNDVSGNGHHGAIHGSVTATADQYGAANGAMKFARVPASGILDSYIQIPDAADLRMNNTNFTLNVWVKLTDYNDDYYGGGSQIASKRNSFTSGWGWSITGDRYNLGGTAPTGPGHAYFGPGGSSNFGITTNTVSTATWHMLTAVYTYVGGTSNTVALYMDGVLQTTAGSLSVPSASDTGDMIIGNDTYSGLHYQFEGDMDDLRLYNIALTGTQITSLYGNHNSTGLIAYWPLGGNTKDFSGNGNDGVATNITYTTGHLGNANGAASFNGSSSYITVANTTALQLNNTDFSLNAFVKVSSYPTGLQLLAKRSSTAGGWGWSLTTGGHAFFGPGGGMTSYTAPGTAIATGGWHMVTVTYKYSTGALTHYLDGVSLGSYPGGGFPTPTSVIDNLVIGRDDLGPNYFFNGAMDDVKIYGKVLTAAEILALKNAAY